MATVRATLTQLAQQVAAQIADIRNLRENALRQLALHAHAELFGVAVDDVRIDRGDVPVRRQYAGRATRVGQVAVFKLR